MDTLIGQVPDTWRRLLLGEECQVQPGPSGALYRITDRSAAGGSGIVPMIRPRDVKDNRIAADGVGVVDIGTARRLDRYCLEDEDIVYVRIGESRRHALAGPEHYGWLFGSGCLRLRLQDGNRDKIAAGYLNHYLGQPGVQEWLTRQTSGVAIATVTAATLRRLPLVLPPLATQNAVADVLDALNKKIAVHDEVIRTTAKLRDTLAPALLTGALPPHDTELPTSRNWS
jgi:hypothetical protein